MNFEKINVADIVSCRACIRSTSDIVFLFFFIALHCISVLDLYCIVLFYSALLFVEIFDF